MKIVSHNYDDEALEDVLDAYVADTAARDGPAYTALAAWAQRYPQYERELTEFAAAWSLLRWLPSSPAADAAPVNEDALVRQGMQIIQERLAGHEAPERAAALVSLLQEGRARGMEVDTLAARVGLSIPLVLKLDRRLIRAATIPAQVVEGIARAIGRDAAAVATYLQGGPRLAQGARYHAAEAPTLAGQEEFGEAVRGDLTLSAEQRAYLLALTARPAEE